MSPGFQCQDGSAGITRKWVKPTLIALLFICAAAGFFSCLKMLKKPLANSPSKSPPQSRPTGKRAELKPVFQKTSRAKPVNMVTCQGTVLSKGRSPIAIINGQTAQIGNSIRGVRIVEITASNVLIECNGKTRRLTPGESFTPEKP